MTGTEHRPIAVELAAPRQRHSEELERVFGCPVHWLAAAHRLRFRLHDWNQPTAHSDPALLAVLEDHAQWLLEKHPGVTSLLERLDQVLERAWQSGEPTLGAAARQLGMSARSLQRRLLEEGSAFSERADAARRRHLALAGVPGGVAGGGSGPGWLQGAGVAHARRAPLDGSDTGPAPASCPALSARYGPRGRASGARDGRERNDGARSGPDRGEQWL